MTCEYGHHSFRRLSFGQKLKTKFFHPIYYLALNVD